MARCGTSLLSAIVSILHSWVLIIIIKSIIIIIIITIIVLGDQGVQIFAAEHEAVVGDQGEERGGPLARGQQQALSRLQEHDLDTSSGRVVISYTPNREMLIISFISDI